MHLELQPDRLPRGRSALTAAVPVDGILAQFALAVVVSAAAWGCRLALDPWLDLRQTYSLAFAAVAVAGWLGTWRAGAMAAVICHLWASYFFVGPLNSLDSSSPGDWIGVATYYLIAGVMLFLGHRASALARTIDALRKADSRKAEFLALLAHELRNPLATVRTGLELLKRCPSADPVRTTTARMERQVAQMTRLIDDLLDIARIDRGKIQLHLENLSVESAVAEAVAVSTTFTAAKNQQVRVDVEPGVRMIEADPARVTQVLTNLLHNASKFSPPGSTIHVCAKLSPSHVTITVRDEGMGIATDQLELIFDSFVQVDSGAQAGLGLGLSLVRKLMEMQGGTAEARSHGLGKGAEFTLTFRRGAVTASPTTFARLLPGQDGRPGPELETERTQLPSVPSIQATTDGAEVAKRGTDSLVIHTKATELEGVKAAAARRLRSQVGESRRSRLVMSGGLASDKDHRRWQADGFDQHLPQFVSVEDLERALKANRAAHPP